MSAGDRGRFHGVLQIVRLNWPFYALAALLNVAALLFARRTANPLPAIWFAGAVVAGDFWLLASILVSHWVYDRSPIADGGWLRGVLSTPPREMANLHAGLDESSLLLLGSFADARLQVFDFHDAAAMGEPAIERARRWHRAAVPSTSVSFDRIPIADGALDAAFLIFAAHELRRADDRATLLREVARCLAPGGTIVVAEHLRDAWNTLAFGPGALHFFSRASWLRDFQAAGLAVARQAAITPFVAVFTLARAR